MCTRNFLTCLLTFVVKISFTDCIKLQLLSLLSDGFVEMHLPFTVTCFIVKSFLFNSYGFSFQVLCCVAFCPCAINERVRVWTEQATSSVWSYSSLS